MLEALRFTIDYDNNIRIERYKNNVLHESKYKWTKLKKASRKRLLRYLLQVDYGATTRLRNDYDDGWYDELTLAYPIVREDAEPWSKIQIARYLLSI